ncbi:ankyrin repeat domain-containing protein [Pseudomonas sp. Marseille-Q5115]|uniref:ankyrin repeat domain-containing protein n=1 Tax=Pseudomonas sp. Marseille-Q5115 TaxID=2866593 RepID=UPI001CE4082B|nr:ankyrin repeat domain-containing protein [Pseudomonas sp. Marseille-Q5115]
MSETTQPQVMTDDEAAEFAAQVFDVARNGDADTLHKLLEKGLPANLRNQNGDTLLMLASYHGHLAAARVLLEGGADANIPNDKNQLPLAGAAFKGNLDMAQLLVSHGALVNGAAADGRTALMMAAMFNRTAFVTYLLEQGADLHARDIAGVDALGAARAMGAQETIAQLSSLM